MPYHGDGRERVLVVDRRVSRQLGRRADANAVVDDVTSLVANGRTAVHLAPKTQVAGVVIRGADFAGREAVRRFPGIESGRCTDSGVVVGSIGGRANAHK